MNSSPSRYAWFEIKSHSPLRITALSTEEDEDLPKETEAIIQKRPDLEQSSWICTSIAPLEEAIKENRFTMFPGSPEKLLRLFNDDLQNCNGVLEQDTPGDLTAALHEALLEYLVAGELDANLSDLDRKNKTGRANSRIVDAEAWADFDFQEALSGRLKILDHKAGRIFVRQSQIAGTEKPTLLTFRSWRLTSDQKSKDHLVYLFQRFDWADPQFLELVERCLVESHLLSGDFIVQRICGFQKELFSRILDYLEDRQIFITWANGTKHIIDFLSAYSRVTAGSQNVSLRCPSFLCQLDEMGHLELNQLNALQNLTESESERIQALIDLDNRVRGEGKLNFVEFFDGVVKRRNLNPIVEEAESQLATINYAPGRCFVCSRIKGLPEPAQGAEYPTLVRNQVVPVFLSKNQHTPGDVGRPLDHSFRRNILVVASVRRYKVVLSDQSTLDLAVGRMTRSFSPEDVEGALSTLVSKRIPLHERRAFHLLHLPGRESLDDLEVHVRNQRVAELLEKKELLSFHRALTSDQVVSEAVARVLSFREKVEMASSQEEMHQVLEHFPFHEEGSFPATATLPTLLVLENLLRFEHLEHEGLGDWISSVQRSFNNSGRHVMALLTFWTEIVLKHGPAGLEKRNLAQELRSNLWSELRLAFPDTHEWDDSERSPRTWEEGDQSRISDFASVVLSGVFHRPFVVAYSQTRELPRRHLRLALESIQRLNLLTAILPVCCGDWADSRYFDMIQKAHRVEESRIFSSVSGTIGAEQGDYIQPYPELSSGRSLCSGFRCKHALNSESPFPLLLWRIGKLIGNQLDSFEKEVARCGYWLNSLFDHLTHRHFRCQYCGILLSPGLSSVDPNRFTCPCPSSEKYPDHDRDVYLSWCRGSGCNQIIDSREIGESKRCSHGKYICTECHACCYLHKRNYKKGDSPSPACRSCRRELVMPANKGEAPKGHEVVKCVCGSENHIYSRWDREQTSDKLSALHPRDFEYIFQYNTRPMEQEKD